MKRTKSPVEKLAGLLTPDQLLALMNAALDRGELRHPEPTGLTCLKCKKPLPVGHAGLCRECSLIGKEPPYCLICKMGLPYDPKGKMAWANPPCKCAERPRRRHEAKK